MPQDRVVSPVLSRRELFGAAVVVGVPLYLGGSGFRRLLAPPPAARGGAAPGLAEFSKAIGTRFLVRTGPFRFTTLTLVEVEAHPRRTRGVALTGESFSLIFAGGDGRQGFPSGTYRIAQEALGPFDLSLTPVGMARKGQRYEAVVNRRVPAPR